MQESSIFVSYTSFNKGLQQKFPQCLGSTWEHFAAGRQRVEKLWENTHTDWDHSTPLHRHHLSATWLQTSQKRGRDSRDNTLRVNIMATRPAKLLLHWINRRSSTGKLDEQHLQHRYCGPCCSSLTSEKDWHTVPFVAHFIYSGWSRQRLKKTSSQHAFCIHMLWPLKQGAKLKSTAISSTLVMPSPQVSAGCSCVVESCYVGGSKAQQ